MKAGLAALIVGGLFTGANLQAQMNDGGLGMNRPGPGLNGREARVLRGMSDANILGHLAATDSVEVALSDTTITKSTSDQVLAYAKMMRAAHLGSMHAVDVIARETRIGRNTLAGELNITHLFSQPDSVSNASDQTIDRHYITEQISIHRHVLAELQLLQGVVKNERAREHIDAAIPAVRDHLARAVAIAKARGFSWRRDVE